MPNTLVEVHELRKLLAGITCLRGSFYNGHEGRGYKMAIEDAYILFSVFCEQHNLDVLDWVPSAYIIRNKAEWVRDHSESVIAALQGEIDIIRTLQVQYQADKTGDNDA